jgi:hypothetical protein
VTCALKAPCSLKTQRQSTATRAVSLSSCAMPHAMSMRSMLNPCIVPRRARAGSRSFQRGLTVGHPAVNRTREGSTPSAGATSPCSSTGRAPVSYSGGSGSIPDEGSAWQRTLPSSNGQDLRLSTGGRRVRPSLRYASVPGAPGVITGCELVE